MSKSTIKIKLEQGIIETSARQLSYHIALMTQGFSTPRRFTLSYLLDDSRWRLPFLSAIQSRRETAPRKIISTVMSRIRCYGDNRDDPCKQLPSAQFIALAGQICHFESCLTNAPHVPPNARLNN